MKSRLIVLCAVAALFSAAPAFAGLTTSEIWEFQNGYVTAIDDTHWGAIPEQTDNTFPTEKGNTPYALITTGANGSYSADMKQFYNVEQVDLYIGNWPDLNPSKTILMYVSHLGALGDIDITSDPALATVTQTGSNVINLANITVSIFEWEITPNPTWEKISFTMSGENVLDAVHVETVCNPAPAIPAPGAIVLGSLGVGLVGWMRRRNAV